MIKIPIILNSSTGYIHIPNRDATTHITDGLYRLEREKKNWKLTALTTVAAIYMRLSKKTLKKEDPMNSS